MHILIYTIKDEIITSASGADKQQLAWAENYYKSNPKHTEIRVKFIDNKAIVTTVLEPIEYR